MVDMFVISIEQKREKKNREQPSHFSMLINRKVSVWKRFLFRLFFFLLLLFFHLQAAIENCEKSNERKKSICYCNNLFQLREFLFFACFFFRFRIFSFLVFYLDKYIRPMETDHIWMKRWWYFCFNKKQKKHKQEKK